MQSLIIPFVQACTCHPISWQQHTCNDVLPNDWFWLHNYFRMSVYAVTIVTFSCSDSSWFDWKEKEKEERWWNWRELLRHCGHGRGSCTTVHRRQIHLQVLGFFCIWDVYDGSNLSERHWVGSTHQWWAGMRLWLMIFLYEFDADNYSRTTLWY